MNHEQSQFISRGCPTCGVQDVAHRKMSSTKQAESLTFEQLVQHWRGFFKEGVFFTYSQCSSCNILFCPVYFSEQQLEVLYSQMPDNTAGVPMDALKKTQYSYFKAMKRHSSLKGAYLEVGPDIGLLTEFCAKEGNFDTFWLFEPNVAVHPALRERVGNRTCHIETNMFDYGKIPDHSVSTVAMVHLLDHVLNPEETLLRVRQKMEKNGVIAIVTHNESSLLASLTGKKWPAYCLQHPQLFNPETMTRLLNKCGFRVLEIQRTVNYFPMGYLLKHAFWAGGLSGLSTKIPSMNSIQLPLKLGNMITLASPIEEGVSV